ncbi:MAG TPA: hypothetical protein VGB59_10065 [Allosphingosinicella sp.]|jgi:hypothetical protein
MFQKLTAALAATTLVASPVMAAELPNFDQSGARRSGAVAGAYFKVPLGGPRAKKPAAGLRLSMVHDYRHAGAQTARVVQADSFDLRLVGAGKPTFYIAGQPVTGEQAKKRNLGPVGSVVTIAVLVAAAVGAYYIYRAVDDSGEE